MALQKISTSLTLDEQKVLSLKYKAPRLCDIPADQITLHAQGLLVRIHTITGWTLPDDDFFLNTIVSEFTQFLVENFNDLNTEEIAYAFRTYGTSVKDWGKSMNLSLLAGPLEEYTNKRRCLSELEDRQTHNIPQLPTRAEWKGVCEHYYQQYRKGNVNMDLWPIEMYDEFVEAKYMPSDIYEEMLERSRRFLIQRKHIEINEAKLYINLPLVSSLNLELDKLIDEDGELVQVIKWAKRFAILKLYFTANQSKYENLFIKD